MCALNAGNQSNAVATLGTTEAESGGGWKPGMCGCTSRSFGSVKDTRGAPRGLEPLLEWGVGGEGGDVVLRDKFSDAIDAGGAFAILSRFVDGRVVIAIG
jgi:hypothetical protein